MYGVLWSTLFASGFLRDKCEMTYLPLWLSRKKLHQVFFFNESSDFDEFSDFSFDVRQAQAIIDCYVESSLRCSACGRQRKSKARLGLISPLLILTILVYLTRSLNLRLLNYFLVFLD